MNKDKKKYTICLGVVTLLWHIIYFILFWTMPSNHFPTSISDMKLSVGWYWSELFVN